MKTNEDLQKDVQDAIKWEPLLKAAEIGVTAKDGVITLSGTVDSYAKKSEAEAAAKRVTGVKVVVEQIEIKTYSNLYDRDDNDLVNEVLNAYKWNWEIPNDKVKVKVENGWITLEGELNWNYQREAAERLIKKLAGIKGVSNLITIKSETHDEIEKMGIESALARNWSIKEQNIHVKVDGTKVTLTGDVDSWYQKEEAGRIAWNAPGVVTVNNELLVEYDYSLAD
ncbi:BON domain-containing protein [Dyadobacter frigoris]|uniref:BON domain-containing protein n=1 Tax=Dyadobacter frigoris TaxID=2576211 RepID=A0A4U6CP74_9BACT|nr:BON domain-containing protein [Dyadobacter frigoris]TKT86232.1 BON domain-containing protein [Dyadobacter frigoris]GLU56929.1 ornithine aminotransferase [Dyadobacter frigoris]